MTLFVARTWDSDASNNPSMSAIETALAEAHSYTSFDRNMGTCVAHRRFDTGGLTAGVDGNPQVGSVIGADFAAGGQGTLQFRETVALRVTNWGTSTAFSATVRFNYLRAGQNVSATIGNLSTGTMTPGGNPVNNVVVADSGWTDIGSNLAFIADMIARIDVATSTPTGWQWWGSLWVRTRP